MANRLTPLHCWLALRGRLVALYGGLSRHTPFFARQMNRLARPVIRAIDGWSFRHGRSPASTNTVDTGSFQQAGIIRDYRPLVSVIVPNYNHARYLEARLDSIYRQSYPHIEVILLDDASTDGSPALLESYRARYPDRTRLVVNATNSGGVFHQWQKGISLARGELVWIAESDDRCTENFLDTLVPLLANEAVNLAYAYTAFLRDDEPAPFWSIREQLHDIDPERWTQAFIEPAARIVPEAFAHKNIIPNVSGALFRRVAALELLQDDGWKSMRTCGDWLFYLHLLRGGMLAYSPDATNFYRIHGQSTAAASYRDDRFYREHEAIARALLRYYDVPRDTLLRLRERLCAHWRQARADFSEERFAACFDPERVMREMPERAVNLLMAGYGFHAGGGETFPIQLANLMKAAGHNVTFLDCNQTRRIPAIRESLRADIPVVTDLAGLEGIIRQFGIRLIHSHHAWVDQAILSLLPADSPCRAVVTMHGMYETLPPKDAGAALDLLKNRASRVVYTAAKNRAPIETYGLEAATPVTRIDNALELYPVQPVSRAEIGVPEEAFLLTLVSRAVPEKGWEEAIAAVTRARELCGRDIHLLLIGEGAVYDQLRRQQLPPHLHLLGFRKNIRDYFAASDMGFLPSRFKGESFPLVIIDCLHAGTPVLASAIGEIPAMLGSPSGPAGAWFDLTADWAIDTDVVAQCIAQLAGDPAAYAALRANVPQAAEKFSPARMTAQYLAVYRQALEEA